MGAKFSPVRAEKIMSYLSESGADLSFDVSVHESAVSTNTMLKSEADGGAPEGRVIIALSQTGGRGRMGRSFYSPEGTGIYMSLLLRPRLSASELLLITPMTAVALARALESSGCPRAEIKWVNDLFCGGKKAAGILVEGAFDSSGAPAYAVVGLGINLYSPEGGFPEDIRDTACGAFDRVGAPIDRERLCADVICRLATLYRRLPNTDFMDEYRRRSCLLGREVTVSAGNAEHCGVAVDIDRDARLVVDCIDGVRRAFGSGEARVSYRFTSR